MRILLLGAREIQVRFYPLEGAPNIVRKILQVLSQEIHPVMNQASIINDRNIIVPDFYPPTRLHGHLSQQFFPELRQKYRREKRGPVGPRFD